MSFTATVAGLGAGAPTGTVTLKDGGTPIVNGSVNSLGVGFPIALGGHHTCVLSGTGQVVCWGRNQDGQLGNSPSDTNVGTDNATDSPQAVQLFDGVAIAAGWYHTCALSSGSGVECWGNNQYGQIGATADANPHSSPVIVSGLTSGVTALAAGAYHSCALTSAGGVKCWGRNDVGQLGNTTNSNTNNPNPTPLDVIGLTSGVIAIAAGQEHTCALTSAGGVKCWGLNNFGQLGNPTNSGVIDQNPTPLDVTGLTSGVTAIAAGGNHTCALTSAGGVKCWGDNSDGELGATTNSGTSNPNPTPVDVSGLSSGVAAIAAGVNHTCALTSTGGLKCWGGNEDGELGVTNNSNPNPNPVDVTGLSSGVAAIAAGGEHTCALTSAGAAQCWGSNIYGQLGNPTNSGGPVGPNPTPVGVTGIGDGGALVYGSATLSASSIAIGSHSITATYNGDTNYSGSTSSVLTQIENKAASSTSLGSSPSPSVSGQSVTFTATVTSGNATLTGTVTFYDGATAIGSGALSSGSATFQTTALGTGAHTITAVYSGNDYFAGSTSPGVTQTVNQGAATTSLGSSAISSAYGQSVTITATVAATSPASGTPTGTVTFYDGVTSLGTASLSGGTASYTTSALGIGSHPITAVYSGDTGFAGSTSSGITQTVNQGATTTAVAPSVNPTVSGQSVTFTATVAVTSPASGTPTGTVTFYDGATPLGSGNLSGAVASYSTSALGVGSHTISAVYSGDTYFTASTSSGVAQTVNQGVTTTALGSSANPSVSGQSVTFTATVSVTSPAAGTPTGTVTFKDGATTLSTGTLSGGSATFSTSALTVNTHSITAVYEGDTNFATSTSSGVTQTVNQGATTTALAPSVNPTAFGQSVTFTATVVVTSPASGTPSGTVTFKEGANTLGTGTVSAGSATFTTSALPVGAHTITAVYGGDTKFATSTSSGVTQTVNKGVTTTALGSSANPTVSGQSVTFTATVSVTSPAAGTPTGTVTFKDGASTLGTGTLSGGSATFATSALTVNAHTITAVYEGDTKFATSTSSGATQTVNQGATTTALARSPSPTAFGQSVTFTATVAVTSPASGTPTGTVTFKEGANSLGSGTLSGGSATFTTSALTVGSHTITAVYEGDTNFATSTSSGVTQTVNQGVTTTALAASVNPTVSGQSVTFTATVSVTSPASGTPTGTVTFKDDTTTLGTGTLSSGSATYQTSTLAAGDHTVTAVYEGDTNFATSTSSAVTQTVGKGATAALVTSALNPSALNQSVTFTAIVSATASIAGPPTGTVTFKNGAAVLAISPLDTVGVGFPLAASWGFNCALTDTGGVKCWGTNGNGRLGDGTTTSRNTPVDVSGLSSGVIAVAVGYAHACALTSAGGVKCWGQNTYGQLGDGSTTQRLTPVDVTGLTSGVTAIAAGGSHTCAATSAGGVKCWGAGGSGELGNGVNSGSLTPVDVSGLTSGVVAITGGYAHTCAVTGAGAAKCWGYNNSGELGDGTTTARNTPVDVTGLSNGVTAIATNASSEATCAIVNGGAKCWGYNGDGELGDGTTTTPRLTPVAVVGLGSGTAAISVGREHSCALTSAGGAKCWGANNYGQLGNATNVNSSTAVDVSGLTAGVSAIAVGVYGSCGITSTGAVKCWGAGSLGQLGNGNTSDSNIALDVTGLDVGSAALYGGAVLSTTALAAGTHNITALYNGDATHGTSQSPSYAQTVDHGATTTSLASSANPSAFGQSVTFTATVMAPGSGTPTGTVTFKNGATTLGTGTVSEGTAKLTTSNLSVGSHTITASYGGDANFAASASSGVTQTVNKAASATALVSSQDPSVFGQSVIFTATVSSAGGKPSGKVTLKDGATTLGAVKLTAGVAKFTASHLSVGSHTIKAFYNGSATAAASASAALRQTVKKGATSTAIAAAPNPSKAGQSVTFTATVSVTSPASGTPTGTVIFKSGKTTLGTATLSKGTAKFATSALTAGKHVIRATYGGDGHFMASLSPAVTQTVNKAATTTSLVTALNPSKPGQSVPVIATVIAPSTATEQPTGQITIRQGGKTLGTGTLVGGKATLTLPALVRGSHLVTASYNGTETLEGSTSAPLRLVVDPKVGPEFRVNSRTAGSEQWPAIAALPNGAFVVVWASRGQDGSGYGIYAQRYSATGAPAGPEFLVNTHTVADQTAPAIAGFSDGGFVVVWASDGQDGSGFGIYGQRYTAAGAKVGTEFKVNTTTAGDQTQPSVAALRGGGFVVVWASNARDGSANGIFAQRFTGTGTGTGARAGAEFRVNTTAVNPQAKPVLATLNDGGFVAVWVGQDGAGNGIVAQRYAATGKALGEEFPVNSHTGGDQSMPSIAALKDGGFIVAWASLGQDGSGYGIYTQRYSASRQRAGTELPVNTTTANDQTQPSVAAFPGGGFVVAWSSSGQDGSGSGVYAQAYDATGAAVDQEFPVNTTTLNDQWQPSVAVFSGGDFTVTWTSQGQDGSLEGVYGQRFHMDGIETGPPTATVRSISLAKSGASHSVH